MTICRSEFYLLHMFFVCSFCRRTESIWITEHSGSIIVTSWSKLAVLDGTCKEDIVAYSDSLYVVQLSWRPVIEWQLRFATTHSSTDAGGFPWQRLKTVVALWWRHSAKFWAKSEMNIGCRQDDVTNSPLVSACWGLMFHTIVYSRVKQHNSVTIL